MKILHIVIRQLIVFQSWCVSSAAMVRASLFPDRSPWILPPLPPFLLPKITENFVMYLIYWEEVRSQGKGRLRFLWMPSYGTRLPPFLPFRPFAAELRSIFLSLSLSNFLSAALGL